MKFSLVIQTILILILLTVGSSARDRISRLLELLKKDERGKSWPFEEISDCDGVETKDTTYDPTTDYYLPRISGCGLNRFSKEDPVQLLKRHFDDPSVSDEWLLRALKLANDIEKMDSNKNTVETNEEEERIVGGEELQAGKFPWLVAVGTNERGPKCGGTLIADQWVVTAAHCFKDLEYPCKFNIRLGAVNWRNDEDGTHLDRAVSAIYRHPDYDDETSLNDVALLKLSEKVPLDKNSNINAICLPEGGRSVSVKTVCMAAGWGYRQESQKTGMESQAREVAIPVIAYGSTDQVDVRCGEYPVDTFYPGMICAGYKAGHLDTCQGDSGGPLMYNRNGRWTQLGLTSFGTGCARAGFPGVYTDVGQFLSWIAFTINKNSA